MGGKAGITTRALPVSVLWLSQPGKGHQPTSESNVAATNIKRVIKGNFSFLSSKERFHPASALRMSGQEDELPQKINYSCYLQMDLVSY